MSEVNLSALAEAAENDHVQRKSQTPMQEVSSALKECKFGWFHIQLLVTSFFAACAGVYNTSTVPYILPIAECDLNMDLYMKGYLTASPYVGMLVSSMIGGVLTDTFGRKIFLVVGYGSMALFNALASLTQTYLVLIVLKFLEGIVFAIAFSPQVTYTSELCHNGIRDKIMLLQSSFIAVSHVILACISWAVLMQDWKYSMFEGFIVMHTWNFYLLILTFNSVLACVLYSLLPESPKFLVSQHRYDEARDVLIYIYTTNTRKPADTYPYCNIWREKTPKAIDEREESSKTSFGQQLATGLHNIKPLFRKPYVQYLILFLCMNFLCMLLYNVIRMWFPQLSTIVEHYSSAEHSELCTMLDAYTRDQRLNSITNTTATEICVPVRSGTETYINSVILGSCCIPPYLLSGLLVNKVGKKNLLIGAGIISIGATLGLRWAASKTEVVALFALDMAVGQVMMSLLQATTVEFFPTTSRTVAISTIMTIGRIGSLFGNVMFPILLNMGCVVPFFSLAALMMCVTAMAITLPKKKA